MSKADKFEVFDERFEQKEINLLDYWMTFWKRRWLVAAVTIAVLAGVALKTYTTTPIYTARATLLIERDEPNILAFDQMYQFQPYWTEDFYQTQYRLIQSRSVAEEVVKRLKLEETALAEMEKTAKVKGLKPDPMFHRLLVSSIAGRIQVSPLRQTHLASVGFSDPDPQFAADAVNTVCGAFIDMTIEKKFAATEQTQELLTTEIATMRAEIDKKERDLQAYGTEKNIIPLSDRETTIIDKLGELNKALNDAEINRLTKEAYYNGIKNASPDYLPQALNDPLIQRLREDYARFNREYSKKLETFRPEYPEMQRLKTELDSAKKALETETQNLIKTAYSDYQSALKKEKTLEEAFNMQKKESALANSNAVSYNSLRMEINNKKNLLDYLLKRQSETGVSASLRGLRTSNIKLVDRAEVPLFPSSPNKKKNLLLGFIVGLMGGLGLAFLLDYLDNSVKNSEDVEKYAKLPTWGIVPTFDPDGFRKGYGYGYGYGHRKKGTEGAVKGKAGGAEAKGKDDALPRLKFIELISYFAPKSSFAESYRSIRTALLLSSPETQLKILVVTSPLPIEGKTATICNLAVTLAQMNKRVLILDADLRKPRQHKIFGIKNLNGLTNYLASRLELKELIKPTYIPSLFLVNAGPVPPNPSELLGSDKMASFLDMMRKYFDYVLIDTPPLLAVTDSMIIPKTDGVVLIVWAGRTSREALMRAREELGLMKIKTLGVILNHLDISKHDYYYRHHYYHYYSDQLDEKSH